MRHINLFPDQTDLIDRVRSSMRRHKSILMQANTGWGKTVASAAMIHSSLAKGSRSVFVVPRRELLRQTAETFSDYGIPYGIISAGYTPNPFAKVQLATAGTLARRLDKAPLANVAFIDEGHYGGAELDRIVRHYQASGAWVVVLTATPWKMSGEGLGKWCSHMECGPTLAELIKLKRLSEYRLFAPSTPDLSGIKTTAGDYAKGQLAERMEGDRVLIGNAVRHYTQHAMGRLNVAYCTSVKHAEIVADAFKDGGVPAAAISGKMDDAERDRIIKAYARRELLVLTNCDLLTFGFDLASAAKMDVTIEAMSDLRPTKSLSLQVQKWGRVLRRKDYPALIFDHAGNVQIHDMPDADREWTLSDREKQSGGNSEPAQPTRQCQQCYFVHRPSPACPNCGSVYPVQSRMIDEVEGDLSEVSAVVKKPMSLKQEQGMVASRDGLDGLIDLGRRRGYNHPEIWAAKQMSMRLVGRR